LFYDDSHNVYGKIEIDEFELPDGQYPIKDNVWFLKKIAILSDAISLKDKKNMLVVSDGHLTIDVIKANPKVIETEDNSIWEENLPNSEYYYRALAATGFIEDFLKVHKATKTEDQTTFTVHCENGSLEFRLGFGMITKFSLYATEGVDDPFTGIYPVNIMASIMEANKESEEVTIDVHPYFIHLNFYYSTGTNCQYLLVQHTEEVE